MGNGPNIHAAWLVVVKDNVGKSSYYAPSKAGFLPERPPLGVLGKLIQSSVDLVMQIVSNSVDLSRAVIVQGLIDLANRLWVEVKLLQARPKILFQPFRASSRGTAFTFPERISSMRLSNSVFHA